MKVTSKGQVTIPQKVREDMGIRPSETDVDFVRDERGRWFLKKTKQNRTKTSRFRAAHKAGKLTMSTEEILALTRG
ncbi:MAG: AbrB/MazE/SpoVT family DNA-binding domain-containing protein [Gammaproteobacteria bacterium]|nr:AbrB/MazE/SpoVT family DNA-binding domain-containing protein [Gammaproteobacteria bacterium]